MCDMNNGNEPCANVKLNNGDRVEIEGQEINDKVTVTRLTLQ